MTHDELTRGVRSMRAIRIAMAMAMLLACRLLALVALPANAQQDSAGEKQILRVGWAQDPRNLNPFTALDEEDYTIWAINWDQLVNFDPETLSPGPGIAESWEVSEDRRTVTFTLAPDMLWSDGEPITSADVKYSLESLGEEGALFAGYTSGISSIQTPDDETVVIKTKRPDARVIGGLFVYMLPEHVWGEESIDDLTGDFQPKLPLVGSGPYVVTDFERSKIITMERNENFRGDPGPYDEIQFIKYGTQDAVERALQLGEIDLVREVSSAGFDRLGGIDNVDTQRSASPAYTQLAFNLCPAEICPDAKFNPAVQDKTVRQAIAYAIDREKLVEIATRGTAFAGHGILPTYYEDFFTRARAGLPVRSGAGEPDARRRGLGDGRRRRARQGRGRALARPLRPDRVPGDDSGRQADRRDGRGDRGRVQRPAGQHRQADRADDPQGGGQAGARLRHVHLGLGRRPL